MRVETTEWDACEGMRSNHLRPVVWNGDLVALAGLERCYILAPRLRADDAPRDELAHVTLLCLFHREVLRGAFPPDVSPSIAERWVEALLELQTRSLSE